MQIGVTVAARGLKRDADIRNGIKESCVFGVCVAYISDQAEKKILIKIMK